MAQAAAVIPVSVIPVSVIIVTKNAARLIEPCLAALREFDDVIVVDSDSTDGTVEIAARMGARVVSYQWNGAYPKKRQWCLDHLQDLRDWVLFIDADEIMTPELHREIGNLFAPLPPCQGYFITGRYVMEGRVLRHGLANRKLALFDKEAMEFPAVDDLGLQGMGEVEGHYQPVFNAGAGGTLCALKQTLLHHAYDGREAWDERHRRYAAWEAGMNARHAWPADPVPWRQTAKMIFRRMPGRGIAAFLHSYVGCSGFLDGRAGWRMAADRYRYYRMIALKNFKP